MKSGIESQLSGADVQLVMLPLFGYGIALILQTLGSIPRYGVNNSILAFPLLVFTHLFYGLGFWRGLFTKLKAGDQNPPEVTVERFTM